MELAGNSCGNFLVAQQSACILAFITTKRLCNSKDVHSVKCKDLTADVCTYKGFQN